MIDADPKQARAHQDALEEKLLAQFDRAGFAARARPVKARWAALGAAAAVIAIVFTASRAPADYSLALGQSIEIRARPGTALPQGPELGALIEDGLRPSQAPGQRRQVELKMMREQGGATTLVISVWGAPIAGIVEQLKARVPQLADTGITARTVDARVHTNLAGLLAHRALQSDEASLERLRREIRAELKKEGTPDDAPVEIEVEGGAEQRVRVRVFPKDQPR